MALRSEVEKSGFATTYARGLEIVMQTMLERTLRLWRTPPLLLVHPRVEDYPMFVFDRTQELMAEGYRAMRQLVPELLRLLEAPEEGIFPRTPVRIHVDRGRCIGCGACALRAPGIFQMDALGKAEVVAPRQAWSPLDGIYIRNCPTWAISARPVTGEWSGSSPLPIAAQPPTRTEG